MRERRALSMSALMLIVVIIISLFSMSNASAAAGETEAVTVILYPVDDTYAEFYRPEKALGNSAYLLLKTGVLSEQQIFLKFDLSELPKDAVVHSAKIKLHSIAVPLETDVGIYAVSDDSWSEETLTYRNRPGSISTSPSSTAKVKMPGYLATEWDVSKDVARELQGNRMLSMMLMVEPTSAGIFSNIPYTMTFFSRDMESGSTPLPPEMKELLSGTSPALEITLTTGEGLGWIGYPPGGQTLPTKFWITILSVPAIMAAGFSIFLIIQKKKSARTPT